AEPMIDRAVGQSLRLQLAHELGHHVAALDVLYKLGSHLHEQVQVRFVSHPGLVRLACLLLCQEFIHGILEQTLAARTGRLNRDASSYCSESESLGVSGAYDLDRVALDTLASPLATFDIFNFPVAFAGHRDRLVLVHDLSRAQHFLAAMSGVDRL